MAYNIYTPMQAPTIPASIFSSAAERGAKSAQLLDTPETARLKGEMLGKTKALEMQKDREAIESANIMQERQREALKADKLNNKLAPWKEGLGLVKDVIGVATGVQNVMHNANALSMQKDEMTLNATKMEIERQTASITLRTGVLTAQNNLAKVTQANDDMGAQQQVSEAMSSGDVNKLVQLSKDTKAQSFLLRNPAVASNLYTTMLQKGVMSQSEFDQRMAGMYSQDHYKGQLRLKELEVTAKKKALDELETNAENLRNSPLNAIIHRVAPEGKANDPEYRSKLDIVPADLYGVKKEKDGTRYIDKNADIPSAIGVGSYLIEEDTGKILINVDDNAKEFKKLLDNNRMSYREWGSNQKETREKGKLTEGPNGEVSPTVNRPVAGKLPEFDMKAINARLQKGNISKETVAATETEGLRAGAAASANWVTAGVEGAKSALNKVLPGTIDNVPKQAIEEAKATAQQQAEETLAAYREASPEGKKAMVANIQEALKSIPVLKRPNISAKNRTGLTGPAIGTAARLEETYFKSGDPSALTQIFTEKRVADLEKVRQEALTREKNTERSRQSEKAAVARNADSPQAAARAVEEYEQASASRKGATSLDKGDVNADYEEAKGLKDTSKSGGVISSLKDRISKFSIVSEAAAEETSISSDDVRSVVTELQNYYGWSNQKSSKLTTIANTVQTNPYLADQPAYVKAVAAQESAGKMGGRVSWDTSKRNIIGLMQVGKSAEEEFKSMGLSRAIPEENVAIGKLYLDKMFARFGDRGLAYAAYNAGPGVVADAVALSGGKTTWAEVKSFIGEALLARQKAGQFEGADFIDKLFEILNYPESVMEYQLVFEQLA